MLFITVCHVFHYVKNKANIWDIDELEVVGTLKSVLQTMG
jgi:hypothetical protein